MAERHLVVQILAHMEREGHPQAEAAPHPPQALKSCPEYTGAAIAKDVLQWRPLPPDASSKAAQASVHTCWEEESRLAPWWQGLLG